jgi:hypothetical protein
MAARSALGPLTTATGRVGSITGTGTVLLLHARSKLSSAAESDLALAGFEVVGVRRGCRR